MTNANTKLFLLNVRDLRTFSARTKVPQLLTRSCLDILAVSETWYTDSSGDQDVRAVCPRGYSAVQKPRDLVRENKQSGGGLALFFKSSVKVITLTELPDYRSFEFLDLSVTVQSTKLRLIVD